MIAILAVSALTGALVKLCDEISDNGLRVPGGIAIALAYGALIAYALTATPVSSLWLGAVVAMLITGKMDKLHLYSLAPILAAIAYLQLSSFSLPFFLVFLAAAAVDELELTLLAGRRFVLDIAALAVSLYSGEWLYLASILSFDIAYIAAGKITSAKTVKSKPAETKTKARAKKR